MLLTFTAGCSRSCGSHQYGLLSVNEGRQRQPGWPNRCLRVSHAPQQSEALKVVPPHSRGFCPASFGGSFFVRIKLWFSSFFYLTLVNKPWRQGARFFLYQQNVLVTANSLHLYMARQRRVLTWFCLDWQCRERRQFLGLRYMTSWKQKL